MKKHLQGRASGINVISSGQPGAPSDIRIRGITSFGNNAPLIVVDGVRGNLHDINVNDIESLQVLKDAAAAIYGVAGSNGVIIVTTKRGRAGKAKVSYDMYVGQATRVMDMTWQTPRKKETRYGCSKGIPGNQIRAMHSLELVQIL